MSKCTIESRLQIHNFEFQEKKFWERVIKLGDDKCWKWGSYGIKSKNGTLRGVVNVPKKPTNIVVPLLASRLSYIINIGDIPENLHVLHICDNPECCNPNHTFSSLA